MSLLGGLRGSRYLRPCALLAGGVVLAIALNMVGQVRLNAWQGDFYDALEQHHLEAFLSQVVVFLVIVAGLLTLVVGETWFREMLEVRMREWLTHDLLDQWMAPRRAYLLAFAGEIGVNPDQRMQADAQRLTELTISLSIGLLRSSLMLLSFLGVLWVLSSDVLFAFGGEQFAVPGYLVWCALIYAISGSWLTWWVGRPLIAINAERYNREAELRFSLVRISENAEGISLHGGEPDERRVLDAPVERVVDITRQLASALARLTWITSGYGWLALIVPVLVAAPGYFQGTLSFGGLMMTVGAFNHVQAALRWFVDNFPMIADWRATLLRVVTLRDALPAVEHLGGGAERIDYVEQPSGGVLLEDLSVSLVDGRFALDEPRVELAAGDRLLIVGAPGSGNAGLFRALAGLWPWGTGVVALPARDGQMFVPQRPYLPLGPLRAAVTYPAAPDTFTDEAVQDALARVNLRHLLPMLDREQRWDRELNLEEQKRIAFVRLLLHAPGTVFMDEAVHDLDLEHQELMLSIFENELAQATVIGIGNGPPPDDAFYNHTARLRRLRGQPGLQLLPAERPAGLAERASKIPASVAL